MTSARPQIIDIDIPGLTIAAKVWGPAGATPVLSAHGWLDNAASFDRLAARLDGVRLVAIDLPGHGRSAHRRAGSVYHFIDWVTVLFDVADALHWSTFSLLCHSMGAGAASLAAGTLPERIERMVLLDGLGPKSSPAEQAPGQLARAIDQRRQLAAKSSRTFGSADEAVDTLADIYAIPADCARLLAQRGLEQGADGHWRFRYDLQLRATSHLRLTEAQVLAFLARVSCPTLLVRPTDGWPVDPDALNRRIAAVDGLRKVEVDGGHHVHLAHPDRVARHVQPFLDDSSRTAALDG